MPAAGSYVPTDANPQAIFDVILAPVAGYYDPVECTANAIDASLFVHVIGGFIGVVTRTIAQGNLTGVGHPLVALDQGHGIPKVLVGWDWCWLVSRRLEFMRSVVRQDG